MGDDNKTDGLTVEQKKNIGGLLFWSFVVLVLLSHCRVFREGEGDAAVYVFTLSRKSGWNLFPATIVTEGGNIHLKAFASVDHPNGYLEWISTGNNRVAFNLVVNGNVITRAA
ncbi:MAG: hypothetical protein LBK74_10770 [Treponema sp.]|jgi:hypothetical protein|nr:hypothetical protein [Treponema sp.]